MAKKRELTDEEKEIMELERKQKAWYDSIYGDWDEDDEKMPECCSACGGPWPNCMDNCKIFEDD